MNDKQRFEQEKDGRALEALVTNNQVLSAMYLKEDNLGATTVEFLNAAEIKSDIDLVQEGSYVPPRNFRRIEIRPQHQYELETFRDNIVLLFEQAHNIHDNGTSRLEDFYLGTDNNNKLQLLTPQQPEALIKSIEVESSPVEADEKWGEITKIVITNTDDTAFSVTKNNEGLAFMVYGLDQMQYSGNTLECLSASTELFGKLGTEIDELLAVPYEEWVNPKTGFGFGTEQDLEAQDGVRIKNKKIKKRLAYAGIYLATSVLPHAFFNADTSNFAPYPIEFIADMNNRDEHRATGIQEPFATARVITSHESEPVPVPHLNINESRENAPSKYSGRSNVIGQEGVWKVTAGKAEANVGKFIEECIFVDAEKGENFVENEVRIFTDKESDVSLDVHTHGPDTIHVCTVDGKPVELGTPIYFSVTNLANE